MKTLFAAIGEKVCPKFNTTDCFEKGGKCDIFKKAMCCPVSGRRVGWAKGLEYIFINDKKEQE